MNAPSSPNSANEKPCEPVIYSSSPSTTTPDIVDSATASINQNSLNQIGKRNSEDRYQNGGRRGSDGHNMDMDWDRDRDRQLASYGRQSPEGKDNLMMVLPASREQLIKSPSDQYSDSNNNNNNNGKINVQVTVLFGELKFPTFLQSQNQNHSNNFLCSF